MKPEIKQRWLTALQSGKYIPAEGKLKKQAVGNGEMTIQHCCLGVLAELAVEDGVVEDTFACRKEDSFGEKSEYLNDEVCEWAGLPTDKGVNHGSVQCDLGELNDGAFQRFGDDGNYLPGPTTYSAEIIDYIKENL